MTTSSGMDLLVFGPHPDDIEIGAGGTVARHVALGCHVALCDLSVGEMASNGTVDERLAESEAARAVLGAEVRENLRLPDGRLGPRDDQIAAVASAIRRLRPRAVAAPHENDRHPDHAGACQLVTRAVFLAGLRKYQDAEGEPWRPDWVCYYFINGWVPPSFIVDVSDYYDAKRRALACHRSQFNPTAQNRVETRLTSASFRQLIESRDAQFGATAGVSFAEGFVVKEPIMRSDLLR